MDPQVVVITGASAGVGRATARAFARRGARLGLIARDPAALEATRAEVESLGAAALILPCDVADAAALDAAATAAEQRLGPIDIWINNAMLSVFAPIRETMPEEYRRVTEVTYLGYVYGTLAALQRMLPRDRGVIVQVGSALAYRSIPLQSAYCAAKHAVAGFTEALRSELLHDRSGVRVTEVHLPAVNTPQFEWVRSRLPNRPQPVPPIFQPELAADAILHAALHPRRHYLVGWPTVQAVVANKFVPGLLDRYLARMGYDAQQTDEPVPPQRRDNLWQPVPELHRTRGRFTDRARDFSWQWWLSKNRAALAVAAAALLAAIAFLRRE